MASFENWGRYQRGIHRILNQMLPAWYGFWVGGGTWRDHKKWRENARNGSQSISTCCSFPLLPGVFRARKKAGRREKYAGEGVCRGAPLKYLGQNPVKELWGVMPSDHCFAVGQARDHLLEAMGLTSGQGGNESFFGVCAKTEGTAACIGWGLKPKDSVPCAKRTLDFMLLRGENVAWLNTCFVYLWSQVQILAFHIRKNLVWQVQPCESR